jgi:hypothetical protein
LFTLGSGGWPILAIAAFATAASAQVQHEDGSIQVGRRAGVEGVFTQVPTLRVSPGGRARGEGGIAGCEQLVAHTDANFGGGSFVAQLGFAQGETLACSYVIPAEHFPITLSMAEFIFVTSGATVTTTTQNTVRIWSGPPNTGTLIASYSSDGDLLPHLVMPPGTNGTNLQFMVDPGDPEQIIIADNGTHTFSVGLRIDQHNDPPSNGCLESPDRCCNAFPTTDTSGLAQPSRNWLNGLNCGSFGCPPNGGWSTFGNLASLCRPSGDWVMRVTYRPADCQPGVGACCLNTGSCEIRTEADCQQNGGAFQGSGTTCGGVSCPQPTGACCFQGAGCVDLNQADCAGAGGFFQGPGTTCGSIECFARGACCLPNGSCIADQTTQECDARGGTYQGSNTSCANVNCPQPSGACCFDNGFCLVLTQANCNNAGATWMGMDTNCTTPIVIFPPEDVFVCEAGNATFMVRACGSGTLSYQWRHNGQTIPGATGSSYTIAGVGPSDAGEYDVVVSNAGGSQTSSPARLVLSLRCDANCDGLVNNFDIDAFVIAITQGQSAWQQLFGCDFLCACDTDRNGTVNNFDIDPFVACLTGG